MAKTVSNGKHFEHCSNDEKSGLSRVPEPICGHIVPLSGPTIVLSLSLLFLTPSGASAQTTCHGPTFSSLTINWMTQAVCTLNHVAQPIDPCSCPTTSGYTVEAAPGNLDLPYHRTRQPDTSMPPDNYDDSYRVVEPWGGNALSVYPLVPYNNVTDPTLAFSVYENATSTKWPELTSSNYMDYFSQADSGTIAYHDWATSTETQNSNSFGETLCIGTNNGIDSTTDYEVPGGWIEFPASFITSQPSNGASGWAIPYVSTIEWEQNQLVWPGYANPQNPPYLGACSNMYPSTTTDSHETYWTYYSSLNFGGLSTASQKIIPAVQSVHGFPATQNAYDSLTSMTSPGHVEITYWTQLYGHTRWEAWVDTDVVNQKPPSHCGSTPSSFLTSAHAVVNNGACSVANGETLTGTYPNQTITTTLEPSNYSTLPITNLPSGGIPMTMIACGDFTNVPMPVKDATPPLYPIPDLNLLQNYDFAVHGSGTPPQLPTCSATSTDCWYETGSPDPVYVQSSSECVDTSNGGKPGINYLQVTCPAGNTCTIQQSVPASWTQEPSGSQYTLTNGTYLIGATARTEADNGTNTVGYMTLTLTNGSNSFTVPSSPSTFTVTSHNSLLGTSESLRLASNYFGVSTYPDTDDTSNNVVLPPAADNPFTVTASDNLTLTITLTGRNDEQGNPLVYDIVDAWLEKASY